MLNEFKKFLIRGNVVDLAVGVVIGTAFTGVVNALVADLLAPFIGAVAKVPDFSDLSFTINGSVFMYGHLLNTLISFMLVAAAIFFFVIKPINLLMARAHKDEKIEPKTQKCPECASEISLEAKRCPQCTQPVQV